MDLDKISKIAPIVYLDETGIEEHTCFRSQAWSKVGEKITILRPGKRIKRTNVVATIYNNKVIAPFSYS